MRRRDKRGTVLRFGGSAVLPDAFRTAVHSLGHTAMWRAAMMPTAVRRLRAGRQGMLDQGWIKAGWTMEGMNGMADGRK